MHGNSISLATSLILNGHVITSSGGYMYIDGVPITGQGSGGTSNVLSVNYSLTSGQSKYFVPFGSTLLSPPNVVGNLRCDNPSTIIPYLISGISTSGFNLLLCANIPNSGYSFNFLAA
jgi:hypothetical protein